MVGAGVVPRYMLHKLQDEYPLVAALKSDLVLLITTAWHMPRAQRLFRLAGIEAQPLASERFEAVPSFLPLGYNLALADFVFHKFHGLLQKNIVLPRPPSS